MDHRRERHRRRALERGAAGERVVEPRPRRGDAPNSGQFPFTDPQATNNVMRFYRVRSP